MAEFDEAGNPMMDIARGDQIASARIRANLERLRDASANPEFRRLVEDVLNGRASLREAARGGVFDAELSPHIDTFDQKWEEVMSADQEVVGEEEVERLNGLQAQVRDKLAEITRQVEELRRYQDDLDRG
ncbi:hypothetical protein OHR68_24985 [Spirillospora sp. NBC_00431]